MATAITPIDRIENHLTSPQVMTKFVGMLDRGAASYIRSVMIAVETSQQLQNCTPESIGIAALRAASLQLSCDPSVKQAHLVPYKRNKKIGNEWKSWYEAQFIPHYMGLYTLAMRTNKYAVIDVVPMPKGYSMTKDLESGTDLIVNEEGKPVVFAPKVRPEEAGGWYGFFRTTRGFSKKVFMTVEEIHEHARKFSKSYNNDSSLWKDPNHRPTMEKKTVLLELLRWADLSGIADNALREALKAESEDVIEAQAHEVQTIPGAKPVDVADTGEIVEAESNGEEAAPIELIDPMGAWAVEYAAKAWNVSKGDAAKSISGKGLGKAIDKHEFMQIVSG